MNRTQYQSQMHRGMQNPTPGRMTPYNCSCSRSAPCSGSDNRRLDQYPIGMAYVPWQAFQDLYDPHMGLRRGTLFKELDDPFCGKRGNCG